MVPIQTAIRSALKDCLNIQSNETTLVLADEPMMELAQIFHSQAKKISGKPLFLCLPEIANNGFEPSRAISTLMSECHVILLVTSHSLSHTKARKKASNRGARIASLPGIKVECLERTLTGNYKEIVNKSRKLADILTIGQDVHLTTSAGTDLTFSIARMRGYSETGLIHEPGQFCNLPAGEACTAPVQGSANGMLIVDGSFPNVGLIKEPVKISIKNGYAVRITGGEEAEKIRALLRPFGREGRNIAEIGIGTNPRAKLTGCTLEDEKVLGTVHLALGNNISFGGKVDVKSHLDAVLLNPTLVIDGKTILSNGTLQV
jgi:leucyl aminopeptidase (aminopeptidase T)